MLSLGAYRYRDVLVDHGGPIASIMLGECQLAGARCFQANARLVEGLIPRRRRLSIYCNDADGTGTHASPMVARFVAISECLERWAYHQSYEDPVGYRRYGFDIDPSSNGMAAFPGLTGREARRRARFEAIERASLLSWWEGECPGELVATAWPDVQAVRITNPLNLGVTALVFRECGHGCFAYGHAASDDFEKACARAIVEMTRCGLVLNHHRLAVVAGQAGPPDDLFERRCLFFSTPEGHEAFQRRVGTRARSSTHSWEVLCDREVVGPWTRFAQVWRVMIRPPTHAFLSPTTDYFFW